MITPLFVNRSEELANLELFLKEDDAQKALVLCGYDGVGKTTLLRAFSQYWKQQHSKDLVIFSQLQGRSSLTVELIHIENAIWSALQRSGQARVLQEVGSYLAQTLYGTRSSRIEPARKYNYNFQTHKTQLPLMQIYEGSERSNESDILKNFIQWLNDVMELTNADCRLILLIDIPKSLPGHISRTLLASLAGVPLRKMKAVLALDEASCHTTLEGLQEAQEERGRFTSVRVLKVESLRKEDIQTLVGKILPDDEVASRVAQQCWQMYSGNPLNTYLATAVSPHDRLHLNIKKLLDDLLSSATQPTRQIQEILSLALEPLSVDTVAELLALHPDKVRQAAAESPLIEIVEEDLRGAVGISLLNIIHPSVAEFVAGIIPNSRKHELYLQLSTLYRPGTWSVSDYQYYAAHPRYFVLHLELLACAESEHYPVFLLQSSSRVLLRQWAASEFAMHHIQQVLSKYESKLSSHQKSLLMRDLGYFSQLLGHRDEASRYYEESLRTLGVNIHPTSESLPAEVRNIAEFLIDQADFHRKEGDYHVAEDDLLKAKSLYESLLELTPSFRTELESEMARVAHNIGIVLRDKAIEKYLEENTKTRQLLKQAADRFEEALAIEQLHENVQGQIAALSQLAVIYAYLDLHDDVQGIFDSASLLAEKSGSLIEAANLAGNLANTYLTKKESSPELAEQYAEVAYRYFRQLGARYQQQQAEKILQLARQPHD